MTMEMVEVEASMMLVLVLVTVVAVLFKLLLLLRRLACTRFSTFIRIYVFVCTVSDIWYLNAYVLNCVAMLCCAVRIGSTSEISVLSHTHSSCRLRARPSL